MGNRAVKTRRAGSRDWGEGDQEWGWEEWEILIILSTKIYILKKDQFMKWNNSLLSTNSNLTCPREDG